jgi:hypothetical protein
MFSPFTYQHFKISFKNSIRNPGTESIKSPIFLFLLERQILWKIFGPINTENRWRIRNNMDKLTEGTDIVRYIKAQTIKWLGHIQRLDHARPSRKLFDWKPMGTRPVGRPRQRWQKDVMEDLKS